MSKILIVDDELEIQKILNTYFKGLGYTDVHCAGDGLEAFNLCSQQKFDLICLDHQMPFMTGAAFLTAIRNKPGLNRESPVFMISAYIPQIENAVRVFDNTFFFDKPLNFESFSRSIKMVLSSEQKAKAG